MKQFLLRLALFFGYLGRKFYDERIGVGFAWELAGAMLPFVEFLRDWDRLEDWERTE